MHSVSDLPARNECGPEMKFSLLMGWDSHRRRNKEVARILRDVADRVERGELRIPRDWREAAYEKLFDKAGNDIGRAGFVASSNPVRSKIGRRH